MLFADGALGLLVLGLWLFCIIDVITTPEDSVRNLPKLAWLFIVIVLFDIGCIVWLVAGRNWNRTPADLPYRGSSGNRGVRAEARRTPPKATNPDDDQEFLDGLRARAEEQRRRARETPQDDPPTA